jgi:hypothetical protein
MDWLMVICIAGVAFLGAAMVMAVKKENDKESALDRKYNVGKFPVTSLMGNKYYAEIVYNHDKYCRNRFDCQIYKRGYRKNGKFKDEVLSDVGFEFEGFDYDYIKVVSRVIGEYEDKHKAEFLKKKHEDDAVAANKKLFNDWDGVIQADPEE